jgi:hypothetical protein
MINNRGGKRPYKRPTEMESRRQRMTFRALLTAAAGLTVILALVLMDRYF